jgi:hypothetical protein
VVGCAGGAHARNAQCRDGWHFRVTVAALVRDDGRADPLKKIDVSAQVGDGGIALIHQQVNKMGFVWHERKTDAGIDGEIELRDPVTGEVANRFILIQSKARNRRFSGENDRSFHFICEPTDIAYWMGAQDPVLLVCSHPETGEAWWMHVQGWFSDPAHRASRRIDFDKDTQRFDADAAQRLLNLADPHGRAHAPAAEHREETLTSNLLTVTVPGLVYRTPTGLLYPREVYERQREAGDTVRHDFVPASGQLYSWLPPQDTALAGAVSGTTIKVTTAHLAASSKPADQRLLVQLLNVGLRQDVSADCDWHSGRKFVYFRATADLAPRTILSASGRQRLVFNPKYKKDAPTEISYCQHAALEWQFLPADGQWLCALVPTYFYSRDGYRESRYASGLLSGIKRRERNLAVYHQTRMWAAYLRRQNEAPGPQQALLEYGTLVTCVADRGIDDATWRAEPGATTDGEEAAEDLDHGGQDDDLADDHGLSEVGA